MADNWDSSTAKESNRKDPVLLVVYYPGNVFNWLYKFEFKFQIFNFLFINATKGKIVYEIADFKQEVNFHAFDVSICSQLDRKHMRFTIPGK